MAKNFHNGTNIIEKHDTIFLAEEIIEFLMTPTVQTHLVSWRRRFQPFSLERKVWVIEKFWKHLNSASKNTSETENCPHGPKSLLASVITLKPKA